MSMYIASANHNPIVTARDIAEKLGMKVSSVHNCLSKNNSMSAKTIAKVRETAQEMGYDPRKAIGNRTNHPMKAKVEHFYCGGNFHTREEEVARMQALREEGFSNAEIAKKIGRKYQTVLRNIGVQPDDMTKKNFIEGQRIRRGKEQNRKAYVQSHKVVEHNELVKKVNEVGEKIRANMAEMDTLRKTHMELVAKVANAEADIRKVAEQMGMTVVEVAPVVVPTTEANAVVQTSFLN